MIKTLTIASLTAPVWWFVAVAFGFGVIIGSFLNVYIYRFHTGKSLAGKSHCLSCGEPLQWFELFPVVSYIALRGRCRHCGCHIPVRYLLVELATGLLFTTTLLLTTEILALLLLWVIMAILVVIVVYDLAHFIIPDGLSFSLLGFVLVLQLLPLITGGWSAELFLWDVFSAVGGGMFFLLLWVMSKGQWLGFGDVKLALPLGLLVGNELVFSFVVSSFWIGAIISLGIIGYGRFKMRGKATLQIPSASLTMKSAVPFAPFLVASALIVLFTHFNVLQLFSFA